MKTIIPEGSSLNILQASGLNEGADGNIGWHAQARQSECVLLDIPKKALLCTGGGECYFITATNNALRIDGTKQIPNVGLVLNGAIEFRPKPSLHGEISFARDASQFSIPLFSDSETCSLVILRPDLSLISERVIPFRPHQIHYSINNEIQILSSASETQQQILLTSLGGSVIRSAPSFEADDFGKYFYDQGVFFRHGDDTIHRFSDGHVGSGQWSIVAEGVLETSWRFFEAGYVAIWVLSAQESICLLLHSIKDNSTTVVFEAESGAISPAPTMPMISADGNKFATSYFDEDLGLSWLLQIGFKKPASVRINTTAMLVTQFACV